MRILVLNNASKWAGAEVHLAGMVSHFMERGHDVSVGCLTEETHQVYEQSLPREARLEKLWNGTSFTKRGFLDWRRTFGRLKADACIYEKPTLHAGSFALDCAARTTCGTYITIEQFEPPRLSSKTSRRHLGGLVPGIGFWWYRQFLAGHLRSRSPKYVVANSQHTRHRLIEEFRFPEKKVVAVLNGVDAQSFYFDAEGRTRARSRWGVDHDTFVFGSVRRLEHEKGLDLAIEAFARTKRRLPDKKLAMVLIGEGTVKNQLQQQASDLGLSESVLFPGFTKETRDAYSGLDAFVIPSRLEPLGIALLEAMACQRPSIASHVGGLAEILNSNLHGWLFPNENIDVFSDLMTKVASMSPIDRQRCGSAARDHVVNKFAAAHQFEMIGELLSRP